MEQHILFSFGLLHRVFFAFFTAGLITVLFGNKTIRYLKQGQVGQVVRDDGPQSHLTKAGTPTMGGVLIVLTVVLSTLLWSAWDNRNIWLALFALVSFSAIGWLDDYRKVVRKNPKGLSAKAKLLFQSLFALVVIFCLYYSADHSLMTDLVFVKHSLFPLGSFFVIWGYIVIVGSSNAVNLTDGLDGLASLPIALVAAALAVFAYFTPTMHAPFFSEIMVFCAAIAGSCLGFLWFNAHPAKVFMGDVGSLALGASLGVVALMIKQELMLMIMGGIFVMETISVVLQVASFKLRGKRIFKMAPIHHHFELKGWSETQVVVRFWLITLFLVVITFALLSCFL